MFVSGAWGQIDSVLALLIALVILLLVSLQPWWPVERLGGS